MRSFLMMSLVVASTESLLPGSTRVRVPFEAGGVTDEFGQLVDLDDDGVPGDAGQIEFETMSLTPVSATGIMGTVFAAEKVPGTNATDFVNRPLAGVTLTVDGRLSVDLPSYTPATNDSFSVVTAGTRNGTFADFLYPSNEVTMLLSNTGKAVIVRVTDNTGIIPLPVLLQPEISGTDLKLIWTSVSNATCRVEFNPDLTPSNWTSLPGDVFGDSDTASKTDSLTPSNRFYRGHVLS